MYIRCVNTEAARCSTRFIKGFIIKQQKQRLFFLHMIT